MAKAAYWAPTAVSYTHLEHQLDIPVESPEEALAEHLFQTDAIRQCFLRGFHRDIQLMFRILPALRGQDVYKRQEYGRRGKPLCVEKITRPPGSRMSVQKKPQLQLAHNYGMLRCV